MCISPTHLTAECRHAIPIVNEIYWRLYQKVCYGLEECNQRTAAAAVRTWRDCSGDWLEPRNDLSEVTAFKTVTGRQVAGLTHKVRVVVPSHSQSEDLYKLDMAALREKAVEKGVDKCRLAESPTASEAAKKRALINTLLGATLLRSEAAEDARCEAAEDGHFGVQASTQQMHYCSGLS